MIDSGSRGRPLGVQGVGQQEKVRFATRPKGDKRQCAEKKLWTGSWRQMGLLEDVEKEILKAREW